MIGALGSALIFSLDICRAMRRPGVKRSVVFDQIWRVTVESLPTTAAAGFFVGGVMTIQFVLQMKGYGALGYLGGLSTSGTVRQVGPLLIAFMLSAKVGAFVAAELGTMRVTEQIDAIKCLGADPLQVLIVPRWIAILVSSFALLLAGLGMSLFGGVTVAWLQAGLSWPEYIRHIPALLAPSSIALGVLKCTVFALCIATVSTYVGYHASGGARGVGKAVVQTASSTLVLLVVADWLTTFFADALLAIYLGARGI